VTIYLRETLKRIYFGYHDFRSFCPWQNSMAGNVIKFLSSGWAGRRVEVGTRGRAQEQDTDFKGLPQCPTSFI
jgi:hypothetical protein